MKKQIDNDIFTTTIEEIENKYLKVKLEDIVKQNQPCEVLSVTVVNDEPEFEPTDEDFDSMWWEMILWNGKEIKLYCIDFRDAADVIDETDDDTWEIDLDSLAANVQDKDDIMKIFNALKELYYITCGEELMYDLNIREK